MRPDSIRCQGYIPALNQSLNLRKQFVHALGFRPVLPKILAAWFIKMILALPANATKKLHSQVRYDASYLLDLSARSK